MKAIALLFLMSASYTASADVFVSATVCPATMINPITYQKCEPGTLVQSAAIATPIAADIKMKANYVQITSVSNVAQIVRFNFSGPAGRLVKGRICTNGPRPFDNGAQVATLLMALDKAKRNATVNLSFQGSEGDELCLVDSELNIY